MKLRTRLAAVALAGVAVVGGVVSADAAAPGRSAYHPPKDSLRALAAKSGLALGSAIIPYDLDHADYRQITASQFSSVTPGNEMKWETVEPTRGHYDWSAGDRLVRFAKKHDQRVRGHVLLWHNQLPKWLTDGVGDGSISKTELRRLVHKHVTDTVTHFKGKIWQWDVANEFFTDSSPSTLNPDDYWIKNLGPQIISDAFRWAHAADPKALLVYNDYNIAGEDGTNAKSDAAYEWVRTQLARGVPIDMVGDQGHLDLQYGFPTKMTADLTRYASLGLKVAITEADVRTTVDTPDTQQPTEAFADAAHAHFYTQMLSACLAVKQCISFTVWGFGDVDSWVPSTFTGEGYAGIYDVNLQPKNAYYDMRQLLTLATGVRHRPHS